MKRLIIVRHSKAVHDSGLRDQDRTLTPKGVERAYLMAQELKKTIDVSPEYWLSSYANRALHTAMIFAGEFGQKNKVKISESLYTFDQGEMLSVIKKIPTVIESAIIFGHNMAAINTVSYLSGEYIRDFKPGSVAVLEAQQAQWGDFAEARLRWLITKDNLEVK